MSKFTEIISIINHFLWQWPLLILLVVAGIYLSIRLRFVQFRYFGLSNRLAFTKRSTIADGDISHFEALMTALAATIGMGSIAGVATAIAIGGFGSIFWMWITAILGMATKYGEAVLGIKYRAQDAKGEMCGGPMHYLERGLNSKFLAVCFAIFAVLASFGIGNIVQSYSVAEAAYELVSMPPIWVGAFLAVLTAISILGGIHSISKIVSILVPAMAFFYIGGGLIAILLNITKVPEAIMLIFKNAFTGQSAVGGFAGASVMNAMQMGASRGVFSSEAGMGSSSIAAAAAKTESTAHQALVSMSSVFITTGIVCTITALVIAISGVLGQVSANGQILSGSAMALRAFQKTVPAGGLIVTIALIPFAYSTILGWAYYGEKSMEYLFGLKIIWPYRILFTLLLIPGAMLSLDFVWDFANLMNGLMAIPNLIGLIFLSHVVASETKLFDHKYGNQKTI